MNLHNVKMEVSAVSKKQYPSEHLPEVAICGRSNFGKSSLINKLLNRKNFARVSSSPGKTATINFYNIDDSIRLVDLPGYGFARKSFAEKEKWKNMIDEYLALREALIACIQLVDIRHKPSAEDKIMHDYIIKSGKHPIVIMTKLDKIKKSEKQEKMQAIVTELNLPEDAIIIPFSSVTGEGRDAFLELLEEMKTYG
jgi:GTP-binding protein